MTGKGKNASTNGTSKPVRPDFVGYVNITLTEEDKAGFEVWDSDTDLITEDYVAALELGYKFSVSYDKANSAYLCSVSQFTPGRPDTGLIYTARSSHPYAALEKGVWVIAQKFAFDLGNGYVKRTVADAF